MCDIRQSMNSVKATVNRLLTEKINNCHRGNEGCVYINNVNHSYQFFYGKTLKDFSLTTDSNYAAAITQHLVNHRIY